MYTGSRCSGAGGIDCSGGCTEVPVFMITGHEDSRSVTSKRSDDVHRISRVAIEYVAGADQYIEVRTLLHRQKAAFLHMEI